MPEEGIVKYHSIWHRVPPDFVEVKALQNLNYWRSRLRLKGVIGVNEDNIGFGNISYRIKHEIEEEKNRYSRFVITATQTGHLNQLQAEHLALVTRYSLLDNSVECFGESRASSEALAHAVLYQENELCNSVIHIHNRIIWERARDSYPMTDTRAEYGTPELAKSIAELISDWKKGDTDEVGKNGGIIILGGHRDGIIIFDSSLEKAGNATVELVKRYSR
jgi:ribulose-5-phosphate 4-epimerase/fuculose-1-phosphate aldolase